MTVATDPETAVRQYLIALKDPEALVDPDEITRFKSEAAGATDPIDQLKALSRVEKASCVDVTAYAERFIAQARPWAEQNQVSANVFRQLGVPDAVLRGAGLLERKHRVGRRKGPIVSDHSRGVTAQFLQHKIPEKFGEFTFQDVMTSLGGSPMTVRKAVTSLVENGVVERVGVSAAWSGPGRAPIVFRVIRSLAAAS